MTDVGDSSSNPVTRERFVMRATHASTGGAYCEFDLHLGAGAKLAAAHAHPTQAESFTLLAGSLSVHVAGVYRDVEVGEEVVVAPGTGHSWGNVSDEPAHVLVRLTPAHLIEEYFEAFCRVAQAGGANSRGLPKDPLQFAVMLDAHRDAFALPSQLAQAVAGPVLGGLAALGRARGFRPDGTRQRTSTRR